jgi:hypothetical protein
VALLLDGSTFPLGLNLSTDINLMGRPLLDKLAGSANVFNWAQSRRTARGPITAIRFNADYDNFNEANRRYFCQARVTTD